MPSMKELPKQHRRKAMLEVVTQTHRQKGGWPKLVRKQDRVTNFFPPLIFERSKIYT